MTTVEFRESSISPSGSNITYNPDGKVVELGTATELDFSFVIQASGGYWALTTAIFDNQDEIEDWIVNGLKRNIVVYDDADVVIWEGFVNRVTANLAGLSVSRGPLLDISNRLSVTYAKQEVVGDEIVTTQNLPTPIAPAVPSASQLKYGIFEKIIGAGTVWEDTQAEEIRDTWLAARAAPEMSKQFVGGASPPSVTIECLGWIHFLGNYIYNANEVGVGLNVSAGASDKLTYIVDGDPLMVAVNGDPNGLFDAAGNGEIEANAMLFSRWEDQNTTAWGLIKDIVSAGSIAGDRYIFGVYAGRKIVYQAVPTDLEYNQRLSDPAQRITTVGEAVVFPWNVLPGNWMMFTDFLIGQTQPANLRDDQRAMFIERVAYLTPWGLQLDGGKVNTIAQKLAQRGLGLATA